MNMNIFHFNKNHCKIVVGDKVLCCLAVICFILLLIPVLLIARYDVQSADDFKYGILTHHAWQERNSFKYVIQASVEQVKESYFLWQGNFFSTFLITLQPAVFGEEYYFVVPFIMLGSLVIGTIFFCWALFRKAFKCMTCWQILTVAIIWLTLDIQILPSAVQGFFWFSGAATYVLPYSASLVLYGFILLFCQEISKKKELFYTVLMCLLSIWAGSGNYITALVTSLIWFLLISMLKLQKNRKYKILLIPMIVFAFSFGICAFAPGNMVRQAELPKMGAIAAIGHSLYSAFVSLFTRWNIVEAMGIFLALPILWNAAQKSKYSFPFPGLFLAASFACYASMFCPTYYAVSSIGPERVQNIISFAYHFFIMINIFYFAGWICKKTVCAMNFTSSSDEFLLLISIKKREADKKNRKVNDTRETRTQGYPLYIILIVFFMGISLFWPVKTTRLVQLTSYQATKAIVNGDAKLYYQENLERLRQLEDSSQETVCFEPYSVKPPVLFYGDITEDPDHRRNRNMAKFYGKKAVYVRQ